MSVKILQPGDPKTYITKCDSCGCVFTYQKVDTQEVSGEAYRTIECPMVECKCLSRVKWIKFDPQEPSYESYFNLKNGGF